MNEIAAFAQKFDEGLRVGQEKGRQEGIQISYQKGKIKGKIEVAKNSLKAGISINVIAQITGLSVVEIKQLRE